MRIEFPFHAGERRVQERAADRASAAARGRKIENTIPGGALGFITQQPMAVLATVDQQRRPWASLLFGVPGFLHPESENALTADLSRAWFHPSDPFRANIERDPRAGMLLIELATRRRLRINGLAELADENTLRIRVEEAYPNCPKYIQRRHLTGQATPRSGHLPEAVRARSLSPHQHELIRTADTLFVASLHPERGADASHRGGAPGFAQILDSRTLRIPDYAGNGMFNTLGNFAVHPHAGLIFPDFGGDRTLQLVGEVEIRWDLEDAEGVTGGTGRFWDFHIAETVETPLAIEAKWEFLDYSSHNP